jgi:glycosyltransferase involved in cell wall biosynthesis
MAEGELMSFTDSKLELSIVLPCLNEAETLSTCIKKAYQFLRDYDIDGEVIVADNGSSDGSQDIAIQMGTRLIQVQTRGYGAAVSGGIAAARGKYIIMGDADDSYDFTSIFPFVEKLREDYDLVMGNRFQGGIEAGAMPILHKYLGNPVLTAIGRLFFSSPCGDFHCGLRGFSKTAVIQMDLRTTGMEFASEMVAKAALHKMRVAEVATILSPDGRSRKPHLRSWRDGWRHLRFLLLYSPRWLFLIPGALLILIGLTAGSWLFAAPRTIGNVTFDVHTLMYAALAVLIGFQSMAFATFTKIFAVTEGLHPEDPKLSAMFRYITLETGLIAGGALLLLGFAASLYAFDIWRIRSFGDLDPPDTLRIVIPAITAIALGCQIVLSSFFLSVLGLHRRER